MSARAGARAALVIALSAAGLWLGCQGPIEAGGTPDDGAEEPDPLDVPEDVAAGSLDDLHRRVILTSCAGQAGLCHAGQFEPNLSTPALTYENLVRRPSLERIKQARVAPGDPAGSLLVDKLRNTGVISQMPLGAEPLAEEDIAAIEAWIQAGALRWPGAPAAPLLNEPPAEPELAIFDGVTGERLDVSGKAVVHPGQPLTLRMSVQDFETDDANIYFTAFELLTNDNRAVVLLPELGADGNLPPATYQPDGAPEGTGDLLNWRFDYTFPETVTLVDDAGVTTEAPSAGLRLSMLAAYADQVLSDQGMLTFAFVVEMVEVEP